MPNVLAWLQSGYFDGDAAYRPLLHLWSLGVEEQFYVFLPVILALLWQRHRASLGGALALLAGLSFCACVVATLHDASAAFYLPFFRFWELLAGTWLAWQERAPWRPSPAVSAAAAGLGLALLLGALTWLAEGRDFPGWRAVFPAVGTLLVLAAGPRAAPNRWVFSGGGALPWLGRISYAAYLWHWPVFVFARYRFGGPPPPEMAVLLMLAAVALASASTRWVENPIRYGRWRWPLAPRRLFWIAGLASALLVSVGLLYRPVGFAPPALRYLESYAGPGHDVWREGRNCFVNLGNEAQFGLECLGSGTALRPRLALWGDSYAAHLWPGLQGQADARRWRLAQLTIS
ncbi:MAG: acyltransferase, partial [Rhodocyclaceae bacterium]|nr:acyltransferase [Rhodocyclaceae bacterium]